MEWRFFRKQESGFTLLEMLLTTAILLVLIGMAAMGVGSSVRSMRLTRLDNAAHAIYMAAENRAAESNVRIQLGGGEVAEWESFTASTAVLEIFDSTGTHQFRYFKGPDPVRKKDITTAEGIIKTVDTAENILLPAGAVDSSLLKGYFYLVYDSEGGHVVDVFYSEIEFPADIISDFKTFYDGWNSAVHRSKEIGHYGQKE